MRDIARKVAGKFDHYICHRDNNLRGRGPTEIPDLMRAALMSFGVAEDQIQIVPEELEALDTALTMARRDDLVLVFCEAITACWKKIIYFKPEGVSAQEEAGAPRPLQIAFDVPAGFELVTNERGVMIAPVG